MADAKGAPRGTGAAATMGYIEKNLSPGEKLLFWTGMHWAIYLRAAVVAVVGLAIIALAPLLPAPKVAVLAAQIVGVLVLLVAVRMALTARKLRHHAEYAVTTERVVFKVGKSKHQVIESRLAAVQKLEVEQDVLGTSFGYATVNLVEVGGRLKGRFPLVVEALALSKCVEQQKQALKKPKKNWAMAERQVGPVTVLQVSGRIVFDGSEGLDEKLQSLIAAGQVKLVLECSGVQAIDSSGIGAIARAASDTAKRQGKLKLLNPSSRVQQGLALVRLLPLVEEFRSEEEAVASPWH